MALNSYKLGIMLSFMFWTQEVISVEDVNAYLQLMTLISVLAFVLVAFIVDDAPSRHPSTSNQSCVPGHQRRKSITLQQKKRKKKRLPTKQKANISISSMPLAASSDIERGEAAMESRSLLDPQNLSQVSSMSEQYGTIPSPPSLQQNPLELPPQSPYNSPIDHDQIWPLMKECFSLRGFSQCSVVYVVAGVITNTLMTFIGDFVQMNNEPQLGVWVIGGGFPFITMISTWIFTKFVNRPRRMYKVITSLLVLVAVTLLLCSMRVGASLSMGICILLVGFFVGPLQFFSTKLGSCVARPLSESDGEFFVISSE
jgi:hypothetical protein